MATFRIILNKSKSDKQNRHPILIRFRHKEGDKSVSTKLKCTTEQWDDNKQRIRKNAPDFRVKNQFLIKCEAIAEQVIDRLNISGEGYTIEQVIDKFKNEIKPSSHTPTEPFKHIEQIITSLKDAGNVGNARVYQDLLNSLKNFVNDKQLKAPKTYKEISVKFLDDFEAYLRQRLRESNSNRGDGGISTRMRTLRSSYNKAIRHGLANQNDYPFRNYKISRLKLDKKKRALTVEDYLKFKKLDLNKYPEYTDTFNFFMFSYYVGGISYVDLIQLRWSDISGERLQYRRSKTKQLIDVKLLPPALEILSYYKGLPSDTSWIFPVLLSDNMTENQILNRKLKTITKYNRELKEIAAIVGMEDASITSYVSRHSFATHLRDKGVPVEKISQLLGHEDTKTTVIYLDSIRTNELDDAMDNLL